MLVPLNITGGSYQSRSRPLSAQVTRNFYPELQDDPFALDKYVLQPFPGYKLFGSSAGVDRGMLEHNGVLYKVSGTTFYAVDSSGVHTGKGTIDGSLPVIMTGFGEYVEIATGEGKVYEYQAAIAETTDVDLETPDWVQTLNNTAIYGGDGQRFAVSAVGDATDVGGLDYGAAESNADDLVRGHVFNQRVYFFGERTVEPWWFSGVGNPPLDRVEGGIMTIGLAARMSVANNDTFIYWLADDLRVYRTQQPGSAIPVSNIAISNAFENYTTTSDAIAFCFTLQGQNFYQLAFPTEDKTWVYSEAVGQWFELSRSSSTGRAISNTHAFAYGKNLVADYRNSNIYELDVNTYDENGLAMTRLRDTGPLHGGLLGAPGREIEFNRFELILEKGVGTVSGQGEDPVIMLQLSIDGGRTFGTEQWARIGKSAEFLQKVEWFGLGRASEFIVRVKTSDPVPFSIHAANADVEISE